MTLAHPDTTSDPPTMRCIQLRGVKVHNLKGIDLDIPLGKLVVLSGVSGSGKSSLAFDTLFAEGQRRYIESFSVSARQYLERIERPNADRIAHVPPAIAIRTDSGHQRSLARVSVAGLSEIDDGLRRLFARIGRVICPACQTEVRSHSPDDVLRIVQSLAEGTRLQLCFPVSDADEFADPSAWQSRGFTRAIVGEQVCSVSEISGDPTRDNIWIVADRLIAGKAPIERVIESAETAFRDGGGQCLLLTDEGDSESQSTRVIEGRTWRVHHFNRHWKCTGCRQEFLPPDPALFIADSGGGCPDCREQPRENAAATCSSCLGSRLRPEALAIRIGSHNLADIICLSAADSQTLLTSVESQLTEQELSQTRLIRADIARRLQAVCELGLGHLKLNRGASTLSGGDTRQLMLAAALGSRVTGTMCVLDEPSAGMLPEEMPQLIQSLRRLQQLRNSVIVVDHAPEVVMAADHVIELGPGAGPQGGQVVFEGTPVTLAELANTATGTALHLRKRDSSSLETRATRRPPADWLTLTKVTHRNWRDFSLQIPLGVLCVVSGRSGCGKTSLIVETLFPAVCDRLGQSCDVTPRGQIESLTGGSSLKEAVLIDQSPLTRSSRSNAATWIEVFNEIREVFAMTGEAKQKGFGPQHFSFNAASGGRCRSCRGTGVLRHDMQFLPDVSLMCPECQGTRYRREILEVKYRGRNIAEVLAMSSSEAAAFFRNHPRLQGRLQMLKQIGLDYLVLGQPTDTLSGGEAQRLKLASRLSAAHGQTLIICDEPTAGLHPADIPSLVTCFGELLAVGHSIIAIDNSVELRDAADHVIDL